MAEASIRACFRHCGFVQPEEVNDEGNDEESGAGDEGDTDVAERIRDIQDRNVIPADVTVADFAEPDDETCAPPTDDDIVLSLTSRADDGDEIRDDDDDAVEIQQPTVSKDDTLSASEQVQRFLETHNVPMWSAMSGFEMVAKLRHGTCLLQSLQSNNNFCFLQIHCICEYVTHSLIAQSASVCVFPTF